MLAALLADAVMVLHLGFVLALLIIAGLWTEVCVAMPAIQAAGDGRGAQRIGSTFTPPPPMPWATRLKGH